MPKIRPKLLFVFLSCHYGFINCFEMLNFAFFNITPRGLITCKMLSDYYFQKYIAQKIVKNWGACEKKNQVWISCLRLVSRPPKKFLWSYFGNQFLVEITSWSPLFFDFLTVSLMNQEICESLLGGFWVSRHSQKYKKFLPTIFFCVFELPLRIY